MHKKKIKTLISRLRKIDPAYSQLLGEMIDLDQLTNELSEGEEIILQPPLPHSDTESDEDREEESEDNFGSEDEGDMPLVPPPSSQIDTPASPLADPTLDDSISYPELKIEPRSSPQTFNDNVDINVNVPNVPVRAPKTRVYARKPLPPPRQNNLIF